jgi:hypothetical protein
MSFTMHQSNILAIKPGDPNFTINDGLSLVRRAGFEISKDCPYNHMQALQTCIDRGWLKPVAYMYDYELTFDILKTQ